MYVEIPLPTDFGPMLIRPVRASSVYVVSGPNRAITVDGAELAVTARVQRTDRGEWRILDQDLSAEAISSAPESTPVPAAQLQRLRAAILKAVRTWAASNDALLRYVDYAAAQDRHAAQATQDLRQLTREAITLQQAATDLVTALANLQGAIGERSEPARRHRQAR